jgi:hypothetical protein
MKFFQETTDWGDDIPNHLYLLSDDKRVMYGYIKAQTNEHKMFSKPIGFDPKHRDFKVVAKGPQDPVKKLTELVKPAILYT